MTDETFYPGPPSEHHAWTGTRYINLIHPDRADIDLGDIACALCGTRRYNRYGTSKPWTVGQHSLLVLHNAQREGITNPTALLTLLLHDAPEAYLGDMVRPLKIKMEEYRTVEDNMWKVMALAWGLPPTMPDWVKRFDDQALAMEKMELVSPKAGPWPGVPEAPYPIPPLLFSLTDEACETEFMEQASRLFRERRRG